MCGPADDPSQHEGDTAMNEISTTTDPRPKMHRAWPGPGVLTCAECGGGVHGDAMASLGWAHDDASLDTPPDTTPEGLATVEEREGQTPIVRCGNCGSTRFRNLGETSFAYQRTMIDTEDDDPDGDDYDSGDIDETWSRGVDFAECAECGARPDDRQVAALARAWGSETTVSTDVAAILTAAGKVANMGTGMLSPLYAPMAELQAAIAAFRGRWPDPAVIEDKPLGDLLHG
jgi:hypothetical protein